jgi:hypothetical protein
MNIVQIVIFISFLPVPDLWLSVTGVNPMTMFPEVSKMIVRGFE